MSQNKENKVVWKPRFEVGNCITWGNHEKLCIEKIEEGETYDFEDGRSAGGQIVDNGHKFNEGNPDLYRVIEPAKLVANFLFVSDLEGCELYARFSKPKEKQNTSMCKTAFFKALETSYLTDNENHICFLGDYFDQGPYVFESIIGIAYLKNKFESQVHIILGNRDINKFRLFYESKLGEFNQTLITQVNDTKMFSPLEIQYKANDSNLMSNLMNQLSKI